MALKATIFKANLSISDINSNHYQDYSLTIARHPSENDLRMMFRLAVFSLLSKEELEFTKGLCAQDEPELWSHDHGGELTHWVELGTPDLKRIKQACGKAKKVSIFTYRERASREWFEAIKDKLDRFNNLSITHLTASGHTSLEELVDRNMTLYCTIQDDEISISDDKTTAALTFERVLL